MSERTKLHISDELALPIDAATQTFAFVARKGAGKTYAAGKLNEELLDAGVQCVILDTVGNWYGLRLAADSKDAAFDIPVLGGLRGDIPLEPAGGELVADLVVETGRSVIVDLSQFNLSDRKKFATAFGVRLWQRKKAEPNPSPLFLTLEEAQLIVPQRVMGDDARMVGIYEEIIRLGRNYGIGAAMITQRPQSVNKEVLNQTECLVVLQVNGAQERKALREWITHQGADVGLVDELPALPIGTAYIWSPQWLGILKKVKIGKKKTFDASATPKVGEKRVRRELAPLDLEAFKTKMSATIEKAKENDPSHLKRTIAEQRREIQKLQSVKPAGKAVEIPILDKRSVGVLKKLEASLERAANTADKSLAEIKAVRADFEGLFDRLSLKKMDTAQIPIHRPIAFRQQQNPRPTVHATAGGPANGEIGGGLRRMLVALAQRSPLSKKQLGVRAGLSSSSGTFGTYLGRARASGWIVGDGDNLSITREGLNTLGNYEPLPEGQDLLKYWLDDLGTSGAGRMLSVLAEIYPHGLTKQELGERASISASSGTFGTYLGKLRTLELVEGRGELRATKEFFE